MGFFATPAAAQTFTNLYSFSGGNDGGFPSGGLILSGNTLYGTAGGGGSSGNGAVFKVNTDGAGFTNLYSFTPLDEFTTTNSDGAFPRAGLILSGDTLYGTTSGGGSSDDGTIFAVNTDGTGFTNLYSFTADGIDSFGNLVNSDGANPIAGLVLSGSTLYGTAINGGVNGGGTIFSINTDGTGFTNLYAFPAGDYDSSGNYTNSDGAYPVAGLILSGNTLYGTAQQGGLNGGGTIFSINTNGTGFTNLYAFSAGYFDNTNSDGFNPAAGLVLSGNTLYGTAQHGGISGFGTLFKVNTDGSDFTILSSFTDGTTGTYPRSVLILLGNTLYGTAISGGSSDNGTVFKVNTDGTGFTNLYSFTGGSDGVNPAAGLILSGNTSYGTAVFGGSFGNGTVFSLTLPSPPPQLAIVLSGSNVILTWPTNAIGFKLQSTTNLISQALWSTNLPSPVIVSGQNVVTNSISSTQMFFRLSQ